MTVNTAYPRHDLPGQDSETALLSEMVVALLGEVAILAERLDSLERLLDSERVLARAAIEAFAPDEAAQTQRDGARRRLIAKVFRPLRHAAERRAAATTRKGAA